MRHYKKSGMKLGTDASHTKAIKKGLVQALLANDRIKTTLPRAKAIRGDVDRVVTWAKRGDLAARRLAIKKVGDAALVGEIFQKAEQGLWADRNGGYTRIMKLGRRKGDNAEMVIIEMVTESVTPKVKKEQTSVKPVKKVEKADEAVEAAEETAEAAVDEAAEVAEAAAEEATEAAEEAADAAGDAATEATEEAAEAAETAADEAAEAVEEAAETAAEEAPAAEEPAEEPAAEE